MNTLYGDLIRQAREEAGLTIAQLADRSFIKEWYLERAEEGEPVLSDADLVLIANVLDISSVGLMEGELRRKAEMPNLEELLGRLENKVIELQKSIQEMKAAAAAIIGRQIEPELNVEKEKTVKAGTAEKTPANTAESTAAPEPSKEIQAPLL